MLEVLLLTFVLIILAVAGLGIKLLFDKKAEFKGGSCQATASSEALNAKGISCGCGSNGCDSR
ncbi:MAG: hypothetical protein PF450_09260 [Bacteroidales bacterium]|jgi:hypothetical protein|nr:hypothetical protein [Bacteroidales bacterium]